MERAGMTRKLLLHGLAAKGFGHDQLVEMQKLMNAEKSDIFDVLACCGTSEELTATAHDDKSMALWLKDLIQICGL